MHMQVAELFYLYYPIPTQGQDLTISLNLSLKNIDQRHTCTFLYLKNAHITQNIFGVGCGGGVLF